MLGERNARRLRRKTRPWSQSTLLRKKKRDEEREKRKTRGRGTEDDEKKEEDEEERRTEEDKGRGGRGLVVTFCAIGLRAARSYLSTSVPWHLTREASEMKLDEHPFVQMHAQLPEQPHSRRVTGFFCWATGWWFLDSLVSPPRLRD